MKKLIVLSSSVAALGVAVVAGATQAEGADVASGQMATTAGLVLEWGAGAPPAYVASRSSIALPSRGSGPLFELRWGDGGPPELVRLATE